MAVRLSVVMIHTPPAGLAKQALSEDIVGQLIGLPGIDVTLVGPIRSLVADSTDRLTLDSIGGDVVMLDWQPAEASLADLAAIGFTGVRAAHPNDPNPPDQGTSPLRRIYAFDLGTFSEGSTVVAALLKLRDHRRVKTLSIGLAPPTQSGPRPSTTTTTTPSESSSEPQRARAPQPLPRQDAAPNGRAQPNPPQPNGKPTSAASAAAANEKPSDREPESKRTEPPRPISIDLDGLLDQLDELDP